MNKKLFFIMALSVVMVFEVSAHANGSDLEIYSETILNSSTSIDFMAFGGSVFNTGNPILAGALNIPFGLWSWMNQDWFGGVFVSLCQIGGVGLLASGEEMMSAIGLGLVVGGTVGGIIRGFLLSKAYGSGYANASDNNPFNNISLVVFPDAKRRTVGSFTYSLSLK